MNERHLHFNVTTGVFFLLFYIVAMNGLKLAVNKRPVPGLTDLVNNVTGH